ncbi:MAG: hypothetical protein K0S29_227 [Gammaproteobacteria bacterium]|jgi:hypothetical protein|nr:hypothetical protein [Gammaproteobacteria bacterium]
MNGNNAQTGEAQATEEVRALSSNITVQFDTCKMDEHIKNLSESIRNISVIRTPEINYLPISVSNDSRVTQFVRELTERQALEALLSPISKSSLLFGAMLNSPIVPTEPAAARAEETAATSKLYVDAEGGIHFTPEPGNQ